MGVGDQPKHTPLMKGKPLSLASRANFQALDGQGHG